MSTENASGQPEGLTQPADTSGQQTNVTGTQENPEVQAEERKFTQAELDEKLQKRLAKERRTAEARYQSLEQQIAELRTPKASAEVKTESAPKREEFSSYEDFVEAKALHTARTEARKELEAFKNKTKQKEQESKASKAQQDFQKRVDAVVEMGQKAYADFDAIINEAVEDGLIPTKGPIYEAIMDSDVGEKLAYHLAKNPDVAERIQKLSAYAAIRELGKLEDKLTAKKEARETMEPITGRSNSNAGFSENMSMDAYVKARNKQLKAGN
jgi:hypothetical protein